jgi:putative oxidoreductase
MATVIGFTELVGGVLIALGAGSRFVAAALTVVMLGALFTAHADEAFLSIEALTEQAPYPFLVFSLVVLAFGAGRLSVDGWLSVYRAKRVLPQASRDAR